jgi:hypothetical protein
MMRGARAPNPRSANPVKSPLKARSRAGRRASKCIPKASGNGAIHVKVIAHRWVLGLKGDIRGSGEKGSTNAVCPGAPPTAVLSVAAVSSACSLGHQGDTAPVTFRAFR